MLLIDLVQSVGGYKDLSFLLMNLLGLCYLGTEGVRDTGRHYRDQKVRVTQFKVGGDITAGPVLDCLAHMVGLIGDSLVVVQYIPYC